MSLNLRAWLGASTLWVGVLSSALLPGPAHAAATLQIIKGSGDFQSMETAITVINPTKVLLEWSHDRTGVIAGYWEVTDVTPRLGIVTPPGQVSPVLVPPVVASGFAQPVPAIGSKGTFTIPINHFLTAPTTTTLRKYSIRVRPMADGYVMLGSASPAVTVTQIPPAPDTQFGGSARYPKVEIVTYNEQIGVVPQTQLHYAGASVTVRLRNSYAAVSDPAWLSIKDRHGLMRQNTSKIWVPSMPRNSSQLVTVQLDAVLPPPKSQLPQEQQYNEWFASYRERCGVELNAVFDFGGPLNQAPMGDHAELPLVQEGWSQYANSAVANQICDGKSCVNVCRMEKSIRNRLDGHVVGYSFLAGQYPRFGAGGYARTDANGPAQAFTPQTKITVASVSKFVTAVATLAVLEKRGVLPGASIGPYLPADWSAVNAKVRSITFAQLLSQTSGIKDYGNQTLDYARLKAYFSQAPVANSNMTACSSFDVENPPNSLNPNDKNNCYSNYNTAIMRILLPKLAGYAEDPNLATRPLTLATQYVALVQENVFNRVGRPGVTCKPPTEQPAASNYALAYLYPGSASGHDPMDLTHNCGGVGWYLSAEDIGKVLMSLSAQDGVVLPPGGMLTLLNGPFSLNVATPTEMLKLGGFGGPCGGGAGCTIISTAVGIFGPVTGPRVPAVLLLNSDISGGPNAGEGAGAVLEAAYEDAKFTRP